MPTIIKYLYRNWCTHCKDWKLFVEIKGTEDDFQCTICENVWIPIKNSEISENKLIEQRKRYEAQQREAFSDLLNLYNPEFREIERMKHMFDSDFSPKIQIIEDDAGQLLIDKQEEKRREREKMQKRLNKEKYAPYLKLGRNDICLCGSGKKFKKCCYNMIINLYKN